MTSLELWNRVGEVHELAVCQTTLMQLLSRSPLTYLLLQRIGNLTDNLLAEILITNPLLSLRNVVIDYCHNVTGKFFWLLLEQPNILAGEMKFKEIIFCFLNILPYLYSCTDVRNKKDMILYGFLCVYLVVKFTIFLTFLVMRCRHCKGVR